MVPASDPATALAEATLLRGRNSVVRPQDSLGRALEATSVPASSAADASRVEVTLCRSASELATTLQHGASLSLGGGPLPIPLLKARQQFFESLRTTVFSVSLVVQARRVLKALEVVDPGLMAGIELPADSAALDAFVARFGDSYVSSLRLGGEVQGVYTFFAQTREEARQVERAFGGAVAVSGLTLGPELQRKASEVTSSTGVNSGFRVAVRGLVSTPPLTTPEELEAFARDFGSLTLDRPEQLELETRGYETVPELRPVFAAVAENRTVFLGDSFGEEGLLRKRLRLQEIRNQSQWVKETYALYGIDLDPSLATNRVQLNADLKAINALAQRYSEAPSTPVNAPDLSSLNTGSPRLNVRVVDGELMGGGGGVEFEYTDRAHAVDRRQRLVKVGLRAGGRVDQIKLSYQQSAGLFPEKEKDWDVQFGGDGGSDKGSIDLAEGVSIERIHAITGTRVDLLRLTTSDGQTIGGGGTAGDRTLDWTRPTNSVVLGFRGRSKAELDALQAVIAEFGPLRWEPVLEEEDP